MFKLPKIKPLKWLEDRLRPSKSTQRKWRKTFQRLAREYLHEILPIVQKAENVFPEPKSGELKFEWVLAQAKMLWEEFDEEIIEFIIELAVRAMRKLEK